MADRFATRLSDEVRRWIREGLISPEQGRQILARYPLHASRFSRPIVLFSVIGGAFIAAGIALVVSHNWEEIHRWVKLGGVVVLMGTAYMSGLALRDRGYPRSGEGLFVIGGSLLLVGIALIGQIYNLSGRASDPVLFWWVLLLPVAYALPSISLAALAFLGSAAWYVMAIGDPATLLGHDLRGDGSFPSMAFGAAGIVSFGLGVLHGDGAYRRLRQLLEQLGLISLFGSFLWLSWLSEAIRMPRQPSGAVSITLLVLLAMTLLVIWLTAYRLPDDSPTVRTGFLAVLVVFLLYLVALTVAIGFQAPAQFFRTLTFVDWFLLFAGPLALILYGARWDRTSWINWGVVFIGLHAIARYLDLFGTMLQTSLLFFTSGVFVLLLGWGLERMRRRMTAQAAARREGP